MPDKYREIGQILASARREQNKTLKAASENTKILESYLEALENGEPGKLPSPAYFSIFARGYAQYLGIDSAIFDEIEEKAAVEAETLEAAGDRSGAAKKSPRASAPPPAGSRKTLLYVVIAVICIVVAVVVYLFAVNGTGRQLLRFGTAHTSEKSETAMTGDSIPDVGAAIPNDPYSPPQKMQLYLVPNQEVGIVIASDGDTVLNRRLAAGEEQRWEAKYRFHLTLDNSKAVDLYINDRKISPLPEQIPGKVDFEFNQVNYRDFVERVIDSGAFPAFPANSGDSGSAPGMPSGYRPLEDTVNSPRGNIGED